MKLGARSKCRKWPCVYCWYGIVSQFQFFQRWQVGKGSFSDVCEIVPSQIKFFAGRETRKWPWFYVTDEVILQCQFLQGDQSLPHVPSNSRQIIVVQDQFQADLEMGKGSWPDVRNVIVVQQNLHCLSWNVRWDFLQPRPECSVTPCFRVVWGAGKLVEATHCHHHTCKYRHNNPGSQSSVTSHNTTIGPKTLHSCCCFRLKNDKRQDIIQSHRHKRHIFTKNKTQLIHVYCLSNFRSRQAGLWQNENRVDFGFICARNLVLSDSRWSSTITILWIRPNAQQTFHPPRKITHESSSYLDIQSICTVFAQL